jgi:hypothetical protein
MSEGECEHRGHAWYKYLASDNHSSVRQGRIWG